MEMEKSVIQRVAERHGAKFVRHDYLFTWNYERDDECSHGTFALIDDAAEDYLDWLIGGMKAKLSLVMR